MKVYHEVKTEALPSIKREGIKPTSRGTKGQDDMIIKTDEFLDAHRPVALLQAGVGRCHNLYGYLGDATTLIDITDGSRVAIKDKRQRGTVLLRIDIEPHRCLVADLDCYDAIKSSLSQGAASVEDARHYWEKLLRFDHYVWGKFRRPEVMMTYTITPDNIHYISL